MVQAGTVPLPACPRCGYLGAAADDSCPQCGWAPIHYPWRSLVVLLASSLAALVLYHVSSSPWPLYLYLVIGILQLYAVIFSRGEAFGRAATLAALIAIAWGGWELSAWLGHLHATRHVGLVVWLGRLRVHVEPRFGLVAVAMWLGGTVAYLWRGHRGNESSIEVGATYFLTTGAFIFGLWGAWGVLLEHSLVSERVFRGALTVAVVLPCLLLIALLRVHPPDTEWPYAVALWLVALSVYLLALGLITDGARYGLGVAMPRLLGLTPLAVRHAHPIFGIVPWRARIAVILCALALLLILAASFADALRGYRLHRPAWYTETLDRIAQQLRQAPNGFARLGIGLVAMMTRIALSLYTVAYFVARTISLCAANLARTLRHALTYLGRTLGFLLVSSVSFSILSLVIIYLLRSYLTVAATGSAPEARRFWGEAVVALILVLLLCGLSFSLAPAVPARFAEHNLIEAIGLGVYTYLGVSGASLLVLAIWYVFEKTGADPAAIRPGPLFTINAAAAIVVIGLAVGPVWLARDLWKASGVVIALALLTAAAAVLGLMPLIHGIAHTLRP